MEQINRVTNVKDGLPDGVSADVKCVLTQFNTNEKIKTPVSQSVMHCKAMCAYSEGTFSLSVHEVDLMLTIRIDELFALMKAAATAAEELQDAMPQEYIDAELVTRWAQLEEIMFVEADSPSGLILSQDWWVFPKGADRDDILKYFHERYSKGIEHLEGMTN